MNHELILRILLPATSAFMIGLITTPLFSHLFYRHRLWKRSSRISRDDNPEMLAGGGDAVVKVHNHQETNTPRIGGVIVWISVLLVVALTYLAYAFAPDGIDLRFINRNQTLLPLAALLVGALLGLTDDLLQIFGNKKQLAIGIPRKIRIGIIATLGVLAGMWFVTKLGRSSIDVPLSSQVIELGALYVPLVMVAVLGLFSSAIIDGVDGLAAGVLGIIFNTYGVIGIIHHQYSIAIFSFTIVGALLAFLWFNVPPARFYLGETGVLSLILPLAIIIFLTDTVFEFLIIGLPLIATALSTVIQIIGRRWFNYRVFKLAPLHHHLEVIGWSREKITMRYWIFTAMCSLIGLVLVIAS